MASVTPKTVGSAALQGDIWSVRARDWASLMEGTAARLYQAALDRLELHDGTTLLDAGCGSGLFCQLAAKRGARVYGLDAAPSLLEIARERVPSGEFEVGDLEEMPFEPATFDVVTSFNSLEYAASAVAALREAKRTAKPAASVVVGTWGRALDCEAAGYIAALGSMLPPPQLGAPGPFAFSEPGALDSLARDAGLVPGDTVDILCEWRFPDLDTALRAMLSAGPAVRAIRAVGERRVRSAVADAIKPYRTVRGHYQLENTFRFLVARA